MITRPPILYRSIASSVPFGLDTSTDSTCVDHCVLSILQRNYISLKVATQMTAFPFHTGHGMEVHTHITKLPIVAIQSMILMKPAHHTCHNTTVTSMCVWWDLQDMMSDRPAAEIIGANPLTIRGLVPDTFVTGWCYYIWGEPRWRLTVGANRVDWMIMVQFKQGTVVSNSCSITHKDCQGDGSGWATWGQHQVKAHQCGNQCQTSIRWCTKSG